MRTRISGWLLVLTILVAVPFWWLLIDNDRVEAAPKPIHIAELRGLAQAMRGAHPTAVNFALLATRRTPGDYWAAGIGIKRRTLAIIAWSLPVPDHGPILIDPGLPPAAASVGSFDNYDRARQSQIDAEASVASLVLTTRGSIHVKARKAGSSLPRGAASGKAATVNAGPRRTPAVQTASVAAAQAVAPGVVVIPAPGCAPDARLIFVQLADGQEFLFTGNIATFSENWLRLRFRSRLAEAWSPAQNRRETVSWLRTIRRLHDEAPNIRIVPGHDFSWLVGQRSSGAISELPMGPAITLDKR